MVAPTDASSGVAAGAAAENVAVDRLDYAKAGATTCPDGVTACPAGTTCVGDSNANTKWGCCMVPASKHMLCTGPPFSFCTL